MPISEADVKERLDASSISLIWRELATMQGQQLQQQQQLTELYKSQLDYQNKISDDLTTIKDILSQARGGWKVFVTTGTAITMAIGGLAWVWTTFFHK